MIVPKCFDGGPTMPFFFLFFPIVNLSIEESTNFRRENFSEIFKEFKSLNFNSNVYFYTGMKKNGKKTVRGF